ncbi:MAG TPA: rhomboid family intramembrane serine protease, partial [Planctomycetes bacterium]|nr:rhomboid family intramembrane serine protease [Planctomycetota bacterium]
MRRNPIGTLTILGIYIFIFLRFGLQDPQPEKLLAAGAVRGTLLIHEPWRLLTATVVHIGFLHLLLNSYFLYKIGPILENLLGTERFLLLYLFSAITGSVLGTLVLPGSILLAGGSTSLFGLMGALLAYMSREGRGTFDFLKDPRGKSILFLVAINLFIGFLLPNISNGGHIGGLIGGFILVFFFLKLPGGHRHANILPPLSRRIPILIFVLLGTLYTIHPFLRTWYQARELWITTDPVRETQLEKGLSLLGPSPAFYQALRKIKQQANPEAPPLETWVFMAIHADLEAVITHLGLTQEAWNRIISALRAKTP